MRRLLLIVILLLCFPAVMAVAAPLTTANLKAIVMSQAAKYDVPPLLLAEVCKKESNLKWDARGIDDAARRKHPSKRTENDFSYGICQVKIETAQWVWLKLVPAKQRRYVEAWDLYNAGFNAATAAIYLKWLRARYGSWKLALAAYNRGHNRRSGESWNGHFRRLHQYTKRKPRGSVRGVSNLLVPHYAVVIYQRWQGIQMKADFLGVVDVRRLYNLHEVALYTKVREPFYWRIPQLTIVR